MASHRCGTRLNVASSLCENRGAKVEEVEGELIERIKTIILKPSNQAHIRQTIIQEAQKGLSEHTTQLNSLRTQLKEIERKRNRWYQLIEEGKVPEEEIADRLKEFSIKTSRIKTSISQIESIQADTGLIQHKIKVLTELASDFSRLWQNLENSQKKQALKFVVKTVWLDKDKNVEVEWLI